MIGLAAIALADDGADPDRPDGHMIASGAGGL
jgi:hypothetical protein